MTFSRIFSITIVTFLLFPLLPFVPSRSLYAQLQNPGAPINSDDDELYPAITADGREIYFNSKRGGLRYHDIFVTRKQSDGTWSKPEAVSELNSPYNDETPFVSEDGSILMFASDRDGSLEMPKDDYGRVKVSYDIYLSKRNPDGTWGKPRRIAGDVNTMHHERFPSLSPDGKTLYYSTWPFADLEQIRVMKASYKSGIFTDREELPRSINSGNMEVQLVFNSAREGFYFSSMRNGLAGWDLYFASFKNGQFGPVESLKEPYNSPDNETGMASNADLIVVSSNRKGGMGGFDLYFIDSPADKVSKFKYRVIDNHSKKPLAAKARVVVRSADADRDHAEGWEVEKSSGDDGLFDLGASWKVSKFQIIVEREGYLPYAEEFDARPGQDKIIDLPLTPVEKDARLVIRAIHFDSDESRIKGESIPYLKTMAEFLGQNPGIKLEIIGHTDEHGTEEYNRKLSLDRASAVRDFLANQGIAIDSLTIRGAGESEPAAVGNGPEFDQKNRRTEFRIIEK